MAGSCLDGIAPLERLRRRLLAVPLRNSRSSRWASRDRRAEKSGSTIPWPSRHLPPALALLDPDIDRLAPHHRPLVVVPGDDDLGLGIFGPDRPGHRHQVSRVERHHDGDTRRLEQTRRRRVALGDDDPGRSRLRPEMLAYPPSMLPPLRNRFVPSGAMNCRLASLPSR